MHEFKAEGILYQCPNCANHKIYMFEYEANLKLSDKYYENHEQVKKTYSDKNNLLLTNFAICEDCIQANQEELELFLGYTELLNAIHKNMVDAQVLVNNYTEEIKSYYYNEIRNMRSFTDLKLIDSVQQHKIFTKNQTRENAIKLLYPIVEEYMFTYISRKEVDQKLTECYLDQFYFIRSMKILRDQITTNLTPRLYFIKQLPENGYDIIDNNLVKISQDKSSKISSKTSCAIFGFELVYPNMLDIPMVYINPREICKTMYDLTTMDLYIKKNVNQLFDEGYCSTTEN